MLNFLVWWNPTTWLSDAQEGISGVIYSGIRMLFYFINSHLYGLIIYLYNMFEALCHGRLLSSEAIESISQRVGIILGIAMLFYVVVSFIQYLINPDELVNEKTGAGNVIKKVLIVIVLLGMSGFGFETLYQVQIAVIDSHIISRIFLPFEVDTDNFGRVLASELFTSFYRIDPKFLDDEGFVSDEIEETDDVQECLYYFYTLKDEIHGSGDFDLGNACLNSAVPIKNLNGREYGNTEHYVMRFDVLFMTVVGVIVVYLLISYCITVGTRMIQLTLLEIISPVAIISYLSPKEDGMFKTWREIYTATYLDVFLRIAVINIVAYLCATIMAYGNLGSKDSEFWNTVGYGGRADAVFISATMIVALLAFAKKAPDLIQSLFPQSKSKLSMGGFHLKDVAGGNVLAATGRAAVAGAAAGAIGLIGRGFGNAGATWKKNAEKPAWQRALYAARSGLGGAFFGGLSGIAHGVDNGARNRSVLGGVASAAREQRSRNWQSADAISEGATIGGRAAATVQNLFGMENAAKQDERRIESLQRFAKLKDSIDEAADNNSTVKELKERWENLKASGPGAGESSDDFVKRLEAAKKTYKEARKAAVTAAMNNQTSFDYSEFTYNAATGAIDASATTFNGSVGDEASVIQTITANANRTIESDRDTFDSSYSNITNYDSLDKNSTMASNEAITIQNSVEHARNEANARYAASHPIERRHGIPPRNNR